MAGIPHTTYWPADNHHDIRGPPPSVNLFDDIRPSPPSVGLSQSIFQNPYVKWGAGSVCAVVIFRLGMYIIDTINEPYRYSKNFDDTTVIDKHHERGFTEVVTFVRGALYSITYPFSKWIKHSIHSIQSVQSVQSVQSPQPNGHCTCARTCAKNKRVVSPWLTNNSAIVNTNDSPVVTVKKIE